MCRLLALCRETNDALKEGEFIIVSIFFFANTRYRSFGGSFLHGSGTVASVAVFELRHDWGRRGRKWVYNPSCTRGVLGEVREREGLRIMGTLHERATSSVRPGRAGTKSSIASECLEPFMVSVEMYRAPELIDDGDRFSDQHEH